MNKDQTKGKDLGSICLLISQLDSLMASRRIDPAIIDRGFKKLESEELDTAWSKTRPDVERFVTLPLEVEGVPAMIKTILYLRILIVIMPIFLLLGLTARTTSYEALSIFGDTRVLLTVFMISISVPLASVVLDRTIRRRIVAYENAHIHDFKKGRQRINNLIGKLIGELSNELRHLGKDPEDCKIELFRKYGEMVVLEEKKGRIFKRKEPTYVAICAMK